MLIDRIEFNLCLLLDSALTVGTGRLSDSNGQNESSVAEIHITSFDADKGLPCIPATTLKGALRARWSGDPLLCGRLFGTVDRRGDGTSGTLLLYAATTVDSTNAVPPIKSALGKAVFDRPATAIDRDSGAAADNKLFVQRAAAAGLEFGLPGILMTDLSGDPAKVSGHDAITELAQALAPLASGIIVGKSTRLGYGRLHLKNISHLDIKRIDPDNGYCSGSEVQRQTLMQTLSDLINSFGSTRDITRERIAELVATATSPFITRDPTASRTFAPTDDGVETRINVPYLRGPDDEPVLWPSSFLGALRSRASWLLEVLRLRQGPQCKYLPSTRASNDPVDDRFCERPSTLGGSQRAVFHPSELQRLSSVERLFGVPGWRGLLIVERLQCKNKGHPRARTSVAIDRLTGGAKDSALFTIDAVDGCVFEIDISLDTSRRSREWMNVDREFLEYLVTDICDNGLMLGHGAARGYGWFSFAEKKQG